MDADDVNNGHDDDPDGVDEVPVPGNHLEVFEVMFRHALEKYEEPDRTQQDETDQHVAEVQADERIEGRAKDVRAEREMIVEDEAAPLPKAEVGEVRPQQDRDTPPDEEAGRFSL